MYALIKVLGKKVLNYILLAYFLGIGWWRSSNCWRPRRRDYLRRPRGRRSEGAASSRSREFIASIAEQTTVDLRVNTFQQICWGITVILMITYACTKHWLLNNLIAVALCIGGIESISIGSTRTAALLSLYVRLRYNVGLRHRRHGHGGQGYRRTCQVVVPAVFEEDEKNFSMLGLGDVVVPGLFLALLLRFDVQQKRRGRPFFRSTLLAFLVCL